MIISVLASGGTTLTQRRELASYKILDEDLEKHWSVIDNAPSDLAQKTNIDKAVTFVLGQLGLTLSKKIIEIKETDKSKLIDFIKTTSTEKFRTADEKAALLKTVFKVKNDDRVLATLREARYFKETFLRKLMAA